jgi:predicted nucleic acid-binding protein
MSQKVIVDTNIFLDNLLNRKSGYLPIGEFAFNFFKSTLECNFEVIIIEDILYEISTVLNIDKQTVLTKILGPLIRKNKIQIYKYSKTIFNKAVNLSTQKNIPKTDALIIEVSKTLSCPIISRNFHFVDCEANVFCPEELTI